MSNMEKFSVNDLLASQLKLQENGQESVDSVQCDNNGADNWEKYFSSLENRESIAAFGSDMQWLNTSRPLSSLQDLSKKIVVLDFFTYCCVNCMHILPDLEVLEKMYSVDDGVVVIGVHSAKFENEKILGNVKSAVLRYNIHHPVVNDPHGKLWDELGIYCWPTILILVPQLKPAYVLMGEGNRDKLVQFVTAALKYYVKVDQISHDGLPMRPLSESLQHSVLRFPAKISCDPTGARFAVSDTGHHRVVIVSKDGVVQHVVGSGDNGFQDGSFQQASFSSPHGTSWLNCEILYVADTENHAIREINLVNKTVKTVVGNGTMGTDFTGGLIGTSQQISSPWDVCIVHLDVPVLVIAMAGTHQIWVLALQDCPNVCTRAVKAHHCVAVAGSGKEENRNNRFPLKAAFAQPSGVTWVLTEDGHYVYVADSESSTIRVLSLKDGQVKGVVGGDLDPNDLFAYGDRDGTGTSAKLQHPLGVAWSKPANLLYVADSYNHKIKVVDTKSRKCTTLCGSGEANDNCGPMDTAEFNEPGGICVHPDGKQLYVADTNNHKLKIVDLDSGVVKEFYVIPADEPDCSVPDGGQVKKTSGRELTLPQETVLLSLDGKLQLNLQLVFHHSLKLNKEAPNSWKAIVKNNGHLECSRLSGDFQSSSAESICIVSAPESRDCAFEESILVECRVYYCNDAGLCLFKNVVFPILVRVSTEGSDYQTTVLKCKIDD